MTGGSVLTSVGYSTGTSQTYLYEDSSFPCALTGIEDENGDRTATWSYDSFGNALTSKRGSSASLVTLAYNTNGTTTVTNAMGVADTYTFHVLQGHPKLAQIDRAATSTTVAAHRYFTYDSNGYLATEKDWNGNQTSFTNDSHGQPTSITYAYGTAVAHTTSIAYDSTWIHQPYTVTTPGLTSTWTYDSSGNPLTRTDEDTTSTGTPYSTNGQTRETQWTWNSTGQMLSVQLPHRRDRQDPVRLRHRRGADQHHRSAEQRDEHHQP